MTQQLTINRDHPRHGFFAAVAELVSNKITSRPRRATSAAPFDPELHLIPPFALLHGPR